MNTKFFSDKEYKNAFVEFGGIREQIAERLLQLAPVNTDVILDFLSGHGFLAIEMALRFPHTRIIGTGLRNDVATFRQVRKTESNSLSVWNWFEYLQCDATTVPLKSSSCDIVTNFLGLEDLNMTKSREGVERALDEITRVTKSNALIQISFVGYGNAPEEVLAREIWETIGLNAVFYTREDYLSLMEARGVVPLAEFECRMQKRMTAKQAREELVFACEEAPRIFSDFGVKSINFHDLFPSKRN